MDDRKDVDEKIYLECSCSAGDHLVSIQLVDYSKPGEDPLVQLSDVDLYLHMQLRSPWGFWRRVKAALIYVFKGTPCNYGNWNETIVSPEQARRMKEIIEKYLARVAQLEEASRSRREG